MAGVFEVYVKTYFSAAHSLKGYQGDCARIHWHNWEKPGVASTLLIQMEIGWRAGRWEGKNHDDMNRVDE